QKAMNPEKRREIFRRFRAAKPNPTTELRYRTPYELLVAVVLSAQATDKSVNQASALLFERFDTPDKMVKLGVAGLEKYIRRIGLYRTKAKNVVALSKILLEEHGGEVPASREALERLPGVGRKTANVVLNTAFGQPTVAVDTHIFRVANRTGIARGKDPLAGMASLALDVILLHPEYHAILELPARDRDQDYVGEANPFLHMSLHVALEEQLSIDQPPGIVERLRALVARHANRHDALHE